MHEQLKEKISEAVKNVETKDIGLAFSGGVDSSLLAKVCRDVAKNVTLLTVGFSSQRDIKISSDVSKALDLDIIYEIISLEELEHGLKIVLSTIDFDRIVRLENSLCFYHVFNLAAKHGIHTVLSANGIDELFCGYHIYKNSFGDENAMINLMYNLVETAKKDKEEIDKISTLFSIEYVCPFLSASFVDFAMKIPIEFKIKSKDDEMKKHILRELALELGVPRSAALRPKKAFQYSSGMHKAIIELARKKGFTRKDARTAGFRSEMEAYIEGLKREIGLE